MRRIAIICLLGLGLPALLVFGVGAGTDKGAGYEVRAIFDNAAYVVKGEDVKVAGAVVGRVKSLDVTPDKKAAITLEITEGGFTPFRKGATCTVRPQSLIGEKFVECTTGPDKAPDLPKIDSGSGKGQHLLTTTSSPVDIDLIGDTMRLPYRQRFALIINEFGTGLAGRGKDLNATIRRANPALDQTDKLLATLASQNKVLADLQTESDQVLTPLAARRNKVQGFINDANKTAEATAERSNDIQANFQRLPAYLRELRPTLADLSRLSDQFTPVLADLQRSAPDLARFTQDLGPFSKASIPALASLANATDVGLPALNASRPLIKDLDTFAGNALPVSQNLDALTRSLDKSGAIERAMDYIFFQMTAVNGFDGISHYLRAGLITNLCQSYSIEHVTGCNANFQQTPIVKPGQSAKRDPTLLKLQQSLARYLKLYDTSTGKPVAQTQQPTAKTPAEARQQLMHPQGQNASPQVTQDRNQGLDNIKSHGQAGTSQNQPTPPQSPEDQLLNYLLGQDGK
jgi:ABC-type transporter Mla subunit MlaD